MVIRCWGQPKYTVKNTKLLGYELFIRENVDEHWNIPDDFSRFSPQEIAALLMATVKTLPQNLEIISFNLDQRQFVDPAYASLIRNIRLQTQANICVELTERLGSGINEVTGATLLQAARRYFDAEIKVCLDDVGTGTNQVELVTQLDSYVTEYKFALQNVRGRQSCEKIQHEIVFWRSRAQRGHKLFALEGIETRRDVTFIQDFQPNVVQGYYFGRPTLLPLEADFVM